MTPRVTLADPTAPATLVNVPDLVDWPATLAGLRFAVTVDAGCGAPASLPATVVSAAADSSLWRALLPAATAVENRVFDQDRLSANPVMTYNGSRVLAGLRAGYAGTYRSSPVALPGHPEIFQTFSALLQSSGPSTPLISAAEVGELDESALRSRHAALAADLIAHAHAGTLPAAVRHAGVVAAELARRTGRPPKQLFPSTGTEAEEFGRLLVFHTVARASEPTDSDPPTGFDAELHSVVTMLHDHPAVMSPLGLLVDLVVAAESLPNTAAITTAQPRLQVTVTVKGGAGLQATTTHYSPWTAFVADAAAGFAACPVPAPANGPELVGGLLNLAAPGIYTLGQVDEDGAVIKAQSLSQLSDGDAGLPAIRTTGPSIIRAEYGTALKSRIDQAVLHEGSGLNSASPVTLYAEDLVRGYRIDVRDHADGVWRSLHERNATYAVPGLADIAAREEGVTQPAVAPDSADPQLASHLYVHESVARWEGWSLSAPRPGKVVGDDGATSAPSAPQPGGVPLTPSFTVVPASLPRLRFGHAYDVRARIVDLGGGGFDLARADAALEQLGDAAPVLPGRGDTFTFQRFEPVLSPVPVATERPSEGESVAQLVIRSSRTEDPGALAARLDGLVAGSTADTGIRYFATCDRHLVPPKAPQQTAERAGLLDDLSPLAAYHVSCKDKGGLADTSVLDIATGEDVPLPDVPDPFDPNEKRAAVELIGTGAAAYPVHHEDTLVLPYLPDWLAAGAVLRDLPGLAGDQTAEVGPDGSLIISTSAPASTPDVPTGSVTTIPFGGTWPLLAPLRLALAGGDAPPAWDPTQRVLTVNLPAGRTATVTLSCSLPPGSLEQLAQRGLTWPLTPSGQLTLIHATQQPVLDPAITTLVASRRPGETGATLSGQITLDAGSTAQLDLIGSWTDLTASGQSDQATSTHVCSARLPPDASGGQLAAGANGEPDTLTLSETTARHEFHDTRHRSVTYQAVASSAFAEHFPSLPKLGLTTASSPLVAVDIPSSAAPPTPRVREAVPMWRWDWPDELAAPHRRYDAGVRVLLEPPWFATGEDEQLAVVLIDPDHYPPGDDERGQVTHWGADPAFAGPTLSGAPTAADFPAGGSPVNATIIGSSDDETIPVVLVPHDVTYDAARDVWVCDIPVDPGAAYMPFVRLAVVRYQAHSIAGCEMSCTVQLPFVQILPERLVTVTPNGPDTWELRVDGPSYQASGVGPRPEIEALGENVLRTFRGVPPVPSLISVTVQQRMPGTTDEAGWVPYATASADAATSGAGLQGAAPGAPLWSGVVALSPDRSPGQFRVLICEYELLDSDIHDDAFVEVESIDEANPSIELFQNVESWYRPGSRRLVFAGELIV
jgi:hypothetical protein